MSEHRGAKEAESGDDYVNTILFTAGTALLMAYLKRAAVTVFAVEQWRIWVFLFLNLVLLAIVFSSARNNNDSNSSSEENQESVSKCATAAKDETEHKKEKVEKKKKELEEEQCVWFEIENQAVEENHQEGDKDRDKKKKMRKKIVGQCDDGYEPPRLSKEELNERADAFIMMFRQHLISDATNGRSNHKRENIQLSKHVQVQLLQVHG